MQNAQSTEPTPETGIATPIAPIRSMHDILSNWFRRAIITVLQESEGPVGVAEINNQVLEWREAHESTVSDQQHRRILEAHLTRLDLFEILAYDSVQETVRLYDDVTFSFSPPTSAPRSLDRDSTSVRTKPAKAD